MNYNKDSNRFDLNWTNSGGTFDLASVEDQIKKLTAEVSEPDFWSNSEAAREKITLKTRLEKVSKRWRGIEEKWEEASLLIDLSKEEDDPSVEKEIDATLEALRKETDRLTIETLFNGPKDFNNAIVTIHPGAGGTESQDWAQMLTRMYVRWGERKGYRIDTFDLQPGDEAGIKSVTFAVQGPYAYGYCRAEVGIHRLVRISPFDANKRRHTSFASVFVSPEIEDDPDVVTNEKELRIDTFRASSAGGQHVNKTSSAI
ncbi:MAG: PCRF domain-containing protein, partial [Nitrospiria bacterium]